MADATLAPVDGADYAVADNVPAPAADTPPVDTGASSPALITTSSASRSNYADNVTGLNAALASTSSAPSPNQAVRYDGDQVYNLPDGKGGFYNGPVANAPADLSNMPDGNGGFYNGPASGAPKAPVTPTDAPTDPANPPTDTTSSDEDSATSSLPPGLASMYKQSLASQDQNISDAKTALAAAAATVANDPAASQAAAAISAQYDVLINAMKEKNRQVIGGYTENAARSGGLQYANDMTETFMSNEMDRASQRISDLVNKEQELILKSNAAYKDGDIKAFNAAQTALTKATADKTTTLGKLLTATNTQVKNVQAQQKIDQATAKQALTFDTTTSAKIAAGMVTAVKAAGLTDPAQIQAYVQAMAEQNGITNPDILAGAFATAQQTAAKTDASIANTASTIAKRNATPATGAKKGGADANYTYTAADVSAAKSLLQAGGNGYAAMGSDGYSDPGAYTSLMNSWVSLGGTVAGFAKVFPPKTYVNPASYTSLPAAIRPKTSAVAAATTYST